MLTAWVVVRLATRRRIVHPWFVAFAVAGVGATLGDARNMIEGPARYAVQFAATFCAFASVVIFVDALRRETGAMPLPRLAFAGVLAAAVLGAVLLAPVDPPRAATIVGIVVAAVLLNAIVPLVRSRRRRGGSLTVAGGIVVYALGRTAMVIAHLSGGDVRTVGRFADVLSIVMFGIGLTLFAIEGLRDERRARAAVGHGQTVA